MLTAVVQSVFFFSPTCSHCEYVINEHLPGIFESFGGEYTLSYDETLPAEDVSFYLMSNGTLQVLLVNTSVAVGNEVFVEDSTRLGLEQAGVPRLDFARPSISSVRSTSRCSSPASSPRVSPLAASAGPPCRASRTP